MVLLSRLDSLEARWWLTCARHVVKLRILLRDEKRSCGSLAGVHHFAAAFEDDAFIDAETWGENISAKNGRTGGFPLGVLARTLPFTSPLMMTTPASICAVNSRALGDDQSVGRINFAAKGSADADRALEAELPLELAAVIDHPCDDRSW